MTTDPSLKDWGPMADGENAADTPTGCRREMLTNLLKTSGPFVVYLVNGIKLTFQRLLSFDDVCFIANSVGSEHHAPGPQLIHFHSMSTLVPSSTAPQPTARR